MFIKKINQKIIIFSDGSIVIDLKKTQKTNRFVNCFEKDLKLFQNNFSKNFLNNLSKLNTTKDYRQKYF